MTIRETPARPRPRPRPTFRTVQVRRVQKLTPHCIAVTFGGDELTGFTTKGPAEHIKVFFAGPGQERPVIPDWGPNGPVIPPGSPRPISRTYTPRRWNPDANELEVHFMTHSDGPGATWAKQAKVGDVVVIAGPGRPFLLGAEASHLLVAGDESALPAIGTILEALPASVQVDVFIDIPDPAEQQELASKAQAQVTWLHRSESGDTMAGPLLERILRQLESVTHYDAGWIACEADVMRSIRRHLLYEREFDREKLVTRGYWKAGVVNHPDHDMGEDV